jgi:hypothetical protein
VVQVHELKVGSLDLRLLGVWRDAEELVVIVHVEPSNELHDALLRLDVDVDVLWMVAHSLVQLTLDAAAPGTAALVLNYFTRLVPPRKGLK